MSKTLKFRVHGNEFAGNYSFTIGDAEPIFLDSYFRPYKNKSEHSHFLLWFNENNTYIQFLKNRVACNGKEMEQDSILLKPGHTFSFSSHEIEILECPLEPIAENERTKFLDLNLPEKLDIPIHSPELFSQKPEAATVVHKKTQRNNIKFTLPNFDVEVEERRRKPNLFLSFAITAFSILLGLLILYPKFQNYKKIQSAAKADLSFPKSKPPPVPIPQAEKIDQKQIADDFLRKKKEFFKSIETGNLEKIKFALAEKSVSADFTVDEFGRTPLIQAVLYREPKMAAFLIEQKVNVNAQDFNGNTALTWAVKNEDFALVKILLGAGASSEIAREDGATAISLARKSSQHAILTLLSPKATNDRRPASVTK